MVPSATLLSMQQRLVFTCICHVYCFVLLFLCTVFIFASITPYTLSSHMRIILDGRDSLRSTPVKSDWTNNETSTLLRICVFIPLCLVCWLTFLAYYHEWMNVVNLVLLSYYFKSSRDSNHRHLFYPLHSSFSCYTKWWKMKDGLCSVDKCLSIQLKKLITHTEPNVSTLLIPCSLSLVLLAILFKSIT